MAGVIFSILMILVVLVVALTATGTGGDTIAIIDSNGDNTTEETVITESMTTELSVSTTPTTSQEEHMITDEVTPRTRIPCRTKTGKKCKKWVYYGETISG